MAVDIIVMIILVLVGIVFSIIHFYNGIMKSSNNIDEAFSTMDVYLKKRYDLIPNLVNTVKGYASHEKDTLASVVELRNKAINTTGDEAIEYNQKLSQGISKIFALAEQYPDLKANENFLSLRNDLKEIENDIANSRKYYNGCVKEYNNKIMVFPNNIIANIFNFNKRIFFQIDNEDERKNVTVEF